MCRRDAAAVSVDSELRRLRSCVAEAQVKYDSLTQVCVQPSITLHSTLSVVVGSVTRIICADYIQRFSYSETVETLNLAGILGDVRADPEGWVWVRGGMWGEVPLPTIGRG